MQRIEREYTFYSIGSKAFFFSSHFIQECSVIAIWLAHYYIARNINNTDIERSFLRKKNISYRQSR